MPLFLDIHHDVEGLNAEAMEEVHRRDLEVCHKHGVEFLKYWFDESSARAFCLMEAPSKEACEAVHREAHGNVAQEIFEVTEGK